VIIEGIKETPIPRMAKIAQKKINSRVKVSVSNL